MPTPAPMLTIAEFTRRTILPAADVRRLQGLMWTKLADDSLAAADAGDQLVGRWLDDGNAIDAVFIPTSVLIADPTNYAVLTVYARTGSASPRAIAAVDTTSVNWTAGVPVVIPVTLGAIVAGDTISFHITKVGTGVLVPSGEFSTLFDVNFLTQTIQDRTEDIYARLSKRYQVPFDEPISSVAKRWCVDLVNFDVYSKRGYAPASEQDKAAIEDVAERARTEIKEAADSDTGLFDLPVRQDLTGTSGVTLGNPLGYSEQSPYVGFDIQAREATQQDINGSGDGP